MTNAIKTETQLYTVRANRGRSRIWIQGKRLAAIGFVPGRQYEVIRNSQLELVLLQSSDPVTIDGGEVRKVSGKGELPIIDISGKGAEPFQTGDAVTVTYSPGLIVIKGEQS